jgi:hypothetical protein
MDLRVYYQKIRKIEAAIKESEAVIVSRETADGGKRGVKTDVPRSVAARLVAEEKADLASAEEAAQYRADVEAKWKAAEEASAVAEAGLRALKNALKPVRRRQE